MSFRFDESNASTDFTRNRLRLQLLPHLEAEYAVGLRERLVQMALLARQDDETLTLLAEALFTRAVARLPDGVAITPDPQWPAAIASRVWRQAIAEVRGDLYDIDFQHISAIQALPAGGEVHLPGVRVRHEAGRMVFLCPAVDEDACPITARPLPVPGRLHLPEAHCRLTVNACAGPMPLTGGDHAVLDAQAVQGEMTVRGWLPGDRFRPLGAPGSRKVQDIFVDRRVPRRWRERIPLIADAQGIIWLAGFRLAERVKITPTTTRSLNLSIEWEFNPWTLPTSPAAPAPNWETIFASFAPPDA